MKRIRAFSLAEAMITLLIVCLITIASIPVITKKKRDLKDQNSEKGHGVWVCYRDANDQLKSYAIIDGVEAPGGEIKDKPINEIFENYDSLFPANKPLDFGCKFVPPPNKRNFIVTYIGAGGGGAMAKKFENIDKTFNTGEETYTVPTTGKYNILLSGTGGNGCSLPEGINPSGSYVSVSNYNKLPLYGYGNSGGYIFKKEIPLNAGDSITMNIGKRTTTCFRGSMGNETYEHERPDDTTLTYNNKTVWSIPGGWNCFDIHSNCYGAAILKSGDEVEHFSKCFPSSGSGMFFVSGLDKLEVDLQANENYIPGTITSAEAVSPFDSPTKVDGDKFTISDKHIGNKLMKENSSFNPKDYGLNADFLDNYGYGGKGGINLSGHTANNGGPGIGKIYGVNLYSGLGGLAGIMMPPQIISTISSSAIWAFPGVGGVGEGYNYNCFLNNDGNCNYSMFSCPARKGTPTKVAHLPVAQGGTQAPMINQNGATNIYAYFEKIVGAGIVVGGEGEAAAAYHIIGNKKDYGGLALNNGVRNGVTPTTINLFPNGRMFPHAAGVGGAGGGASSANEIGKGGKGASGAVIIEW